MSKKYAIIANSSKDPKGYYLEKINNLLLKYNEVIIYKKLQEKNEKINLNLIKNVDIILSLGGDGTFLNIARQTISLNIPIVGINLGSLGFLSEVEIKDIDESIDKIVNNDYIIQERMMLEGKIYEDDKLINTIYALNDFVFSRKNLSRIVSLKAYIDNSLVDVFQGDGLIISTPTGSTGYSLSAGGPVVEHNAQLMLITPVCAHVMHSRSYVVSADDVINVCLDEEVATECVLTVDGQIACDFTCHNIVNIKKSTTPAKLIKFNNISIYDTLRKKMYNREI